MGVEFEHLKKYLSSKNAYEREIGVIKYNVKKEDQIDQKLLRGINDLNKSKSKELNWEENQHKNSLRSSKVKIKRLSTIMNRPKVKNDLYNSAKKNDISIITTLGHEYTKDIFKSIAFQKNDESKTIFQEVDSYIACMVNQWSNKQKNRSYRKVKMNKTIDRMSKRSDYSQKKSNLKYRSVNLKNYRLSKSHANSYIKNSTIDKNTDIVKVNEISEGKTFHKIKRNSFYH